MLSTSYYGNLKNLGEKAYLIQVSLYKPQNIAVNGTAPMFYPEKDLLVAYKQGLVSPKEYVERYISMLNSRIDQTLMLKIVNRLHTLSKTYDVYLLCYESNTFCHRHFLLDYIKEFVTEHTDYGTDWIRKESNKHEK